MAVAVPSEVPLEEEVDSEGYLIDRPLEREKELIARARARRAAGTQYIESVPVAANDNTVIANDNEAAEEEEISRMQDQERVNRIRNARAQVLLASQEESYNQIENEEKNKPSKLRYAPAGAVAIFKDVLDFIAIGSIPVVGTVVTFICSVLIFFLLILAKKNNSIQDMRFIIRRLLIVVAGFLIEGIAFGINFLPIETLVVVIIYWMDSHLSEEQIAKLKDIIHVIDKKPL